MTRMALLVVVVGGFGQIGSAAPVKPPASAPSSSASASVSAKPISDPSLAKWKPPPPSAPKPGLTVVPETSPEAVKFGILGPDECLPGFARVAGICMLDPVKAAAVAAAALPAPGSIPTPSLLAPKVTVLVESALINSSKASGSCWDPCFSNSDVEAAAGSAAKIIMSLAKISAKTGGPYAAVFAKLAPYITSGYKTPDPYGYAEVLFGGSKTTGEKYLAMDSDTLTPMYNVKFTNVPLAAGTGLHVRLRDADWDADDPIGEFTIGVEDLAMAAKQGKTVSIRVDEPTSKQAMFLNITVLPEGLW